MKCRTAAARRRRQRWGVVFQDRVGGVYGPPVLLDGLKCYRTFLATAEAISRFVTVAALPFNLALMQPRGRPTVEAALRALQDDREFRSLARYSVSHEPTVFWSQENERPAGHGN